jgi:cytochrome o ubiquinol oxidase subunit 2
MERIDKIFNPKVRILIVGLLLCGFSILLYCLSRDNSIPVLQPSGQIASKQKSLIIFASLLSLVVVIPVFSLTGYIAWKYRTEKRSEHLPDWENSRKLEAIWWGIPIALITILSVVIWKSSHSLDPYKPIVSAKAPITVQVVALDWKWLFIFPDQKIATVNYIEIPENTPIDFSVTSDAPMNSFWIPELGGQIYAMAGMETHLNLIADHAGLFDGASANISGAGFSGMKFKIKATSDKGFDEWVNLVKQAPKNLTMDEYSLLSKPSSNYPASYYAMVDEKLYDSVISKYMNTMSNHNHMSEGN